MYIYTEEGGERENNGIQHTEIVQAWIDSNALLSVIPSVARFHRKIYFA
jgi:hypothetical protein